MPNDVLCITYYQGAYGPTIRIDTQDKDHLLVLREIFSKLAKGLIQTLEMGADNFPEIHFVGLNKLILKVRFDSVPSAEYSGTHSPLSLFKKGFSSSQENLKTLVMCSKFDGFPSFIWEKKPDDWDNDCREVVDKLLMQKDPCHYYLSKEGIDDALIELTFLEPRVKQ